jgi:hypothetical protein
MVTTEAASRAPAGEAGFRLLAEHPPDLVLRERVEALGGRFRVMTAPGQGMVVEARPPLTDPTEGLGT